jgi:hypothetical protein
LLLEEDSKKSQFWVLVHIFNHLSTVIRVLSTDFEFLFHSRRITHPHIYGPFLVQKSRILGELRQLISGDFKDGRPARDGDVPGKLGGSPSGQTVICDRHRPAPTAVMNGLAMMAKSAIMCDSRQNIFMDLERKIEP